MGLPVCFPAPQAPSKKDPIDKGSTSIYSIKGEFAPSGSKFFFYNADYILEGDKDNIDKVVPLESVFISLKCKNSQIYDSKVTE